MSSSNTPGAGNQFDKIIDDELTQALEKQELNDIKVEESISDKFLGRKELKLEQLFIPEFAPETYQGYHHVTWYVSNAKQAAFYFITAFDFTPFAYKGLETGSREVCCYVLKNGQTIFEFCSPLRSDTISQLEDGEVGSKEVNEFIRFHGEGIRDVSFAVASVGEVFAATVQSGAKVLIPPTHYREKSRDGGLAYVVIAKVQILGDTVHTLVEKSDNYHGFLPGYVLFEDDPDLNPLIESTFLDMLPPVQLVRIDHCVQNQDWNKMVESCEQYAKTFGFHQFWSVDEKDVSTEFSALHSIVMASPDDMIKMPINEPAVGRCKSQIEEFIDFYGGPGVQHIALLTENIIDTVSAMKDRGVEFIKVPDKYYDNLKLRLDEADFKLQEEFEMVRDLGLLVDFDENGYLLQLFTKPLVIRPTLFIEIIQRRNHNGFGAGNFKALFETLESLQEKRGNLTLTDGYEEFIARASSSQ